MIVCITTEVHVMHVECVDVQRVDNLASQEQFSNDE